MFIMDLDLKSRSNLEFDSAMQGSKPSRLQLHELNFNYNLLYLIAIRQQFKTVLSEQQQHLMKRLQPKYICETAPFY